MAIPSKPIAIKYDNEVTVLSNPFLVNVVIENHSSNALKNEVMVRVSFWGHDSLTDRAYYLTAKPFFIEVDLNEDEKKRMFNSKDFLMKVQGYIRDIIISEIVEFIQDFDDLKTLYFDILEPERVQSWTTMMSDIIHSEFAEANL